MSTMCIDTSSVPDKLQAIAQAGFQSVEVWVKDMPDVKAFKKMLDDSGLAAASNTKLEGWFELDGTLMGVPSNEAAILDECRRRIEMTAELDCPYLVTLPSRDDRGYFQSMKKGADMYNKILEMARPYNVCPTLEFIGQSPQVNSVDTSLAFLDLVDNNYAKLVVDVFHIWRGGDEIATFSKVPVEKISLLHFHDVTAEYPRAAYKDRHRVMPGDGILDLNLFTSIAKAKGFSGDISLGVYNHDNWDRCPYEVAREGYEKMRRFV